MIENRFWKEKNCIFSNDCFERVSLTKEAQELGRIYVNEKIVGQMGIEDCYQIAIATGLSIKMDKEPYMELMFQEWNFFRVEVVMETDSFMAPERWAFGGATLTTHRE